LIPNGTRYRKAPFLDISDRVNSSGTEQGLLGLAFHPQFKQTGLLYVNYTNSKDRTVVSSFRATGGINGYADARSEKMLLTFAQPYANHNGGDLAFGRDGYLYIATGDGGSAYDPQGNGQNLRTLLGKILRIDVRPMVVNGRTQPYRIPPDNPFVSSPSGARKEIFAYGLRNPWRISFDRTNGELWAADVGQDELEEVNLIKKGRNYGWNVMEGSKCYDVSTCKPTKYEKPVFEYNHTSGGKSVTGGYVYRGVAIPALKGKYVLADFLSGRMWTLEKRTTGTYLSTILKTNKSYISSFGEDERGELFAVTYQGGLYKLVKR
jgi:hypothetical protein